MSLIGQHIDHIRIDALLGSGGMGAVYLGFDTKLERKVAIKTLHDGNRFSAESKARLTREAKLLSRLGHPSICQIYDLLEKPNGDWLVLEYVDGLTLREYLKTSAPDLWQFLELIKQVCAALALAHRERVVHRDLKPENIMIARGGQVKVLDFGIARVADQFAASVAGLAAVPLAAGDQELATQPFPATAPTEAVTLVSPSAAPASARSEDGHYVTEQGTVLGTRRYMSPEQLSGREIQGSSDIYSLGVLMSEGLHYVEGQEAVPPALSLLIETMQRVDPSRRPSAAQVLAEITEIMAWPQAQRRQRLRRQLTAVALLLLFAVTLTVGYFALEARRARAKAEVRQAQAEKLVQFMLGDLRKRLATIGKLDLLAGVNERAEEYFAAIPAEELTDADLDARVQSLLQIAEVAKERGQLDEAQSALTRAKTLAQGLYERDPARPENIEALAAVEEWQAFLLMERSGDLAEIERLFQVAAKLHAQALTAVPDSVLYQRNIASAQNNLGTVFFAKSDYPRAAATLKDAVAAWGRVLASAPDDLDALANRAGAFGWLSSTELALGEFAAAADTRSAQIVDLRALVAANPGNVIYREDLAVALRYLGELSAIRELSPVAVWREARRMADSLVAVEGGNADYRRLRLSIDLSEGETLVRQGEFAAAMAPLVEARDRASELLVLDAGNRDWQLLRARARAALARVFREQADWTAFRQEELSARDAFLQLHATDPEEPSTRQGLLALALLRTEVDRQNGGDLAASSALQQGQQYLPETIDPFDWRWLLLRLDYAQATGERDQVVALSRQLRAMKLRWFGLARICGVEPGAC